ncbi:MAG: L-threonylcarbamoyladenylate synthase [Bacteroidota bacterium]|nr:L-threonylcarbamoyladenylate synthase [Bacteroidota bacterium]
MAEIGEDIELAAEILRNGGVVAIPTETVYGLAANGLNPNAVAKIYEIKQRPSFNPLILHLSNIDQMQKFAKDIPAMAEILAHKFWPGPLTLVLKKQSIVPDLTTAGHPSVALRMPLHPITLNLLKLLDFPLAAPSANPFGYISPTTAQHVQENLGDKISYILDGGACKVGLESTIVSLLNPEAQILRFGAITQEQILEITGKIKVPTIASFADIVAPGMLKSHYAPKTPLIFGEITEESGVRNSASNVLLNYQKYKIFAPEATQFILTQSGDMEEAAKNLFEMLRKIDSMGVDKIFAEPVPPFGIGLAINDRLNRASINVDNENKFGN